MKHEIRARFDAHTVTVYQAYGHAIADAALGAQRFVAPFSYGRMTWVKPSFLWMMERCGWATKAQQERVLAVSVRREAFDELVRSAVPTSVSDSHAPVRVQWDPERSLRGGKLEVRSLQLGIGRELIRRYALDWTTAIEDVTPLVRRIDALRREGRWDHAARLLPAERVYALTGT
ncbi:MAG: DUF4291 domain-containing protein [Myxococcaceae bacterium]